MEVIKEGRVSQLVYLCQNPSHFFATLDKTGKRLVFSSRVAMATWALSGETLDQLADTVIQQHGLQQVSPWQRQTGLKAAFQATGQSAQLTDITLAWMDQALGEWLSQVPTDIKRNVVKTGRKSQHLAELAQHYQPWLRLHKQLDPAEKYRQAAQIVSTQTMEKEPLILFGFPNLSADKAAFVQALAGPGSMVILPISSLLPSSWQEAGWQIISLEEDPSIDPSQKPALQAFPSVEAEVASVLQVVQSAWQAGTPLSEMACIFPTQPLYWQALEHQALSLDLPICRIPASRLTETPLGAWCQLLLSVCQEGLPFESTLRLLSHPFGPGLSESAYHQALQTHPENPVTWQALGVDVSLLTPPDYGTWEEYVDWFQNILDQWSVNNKVTQRPLGVKAWEALMQVLTLPEEATNRRPWHSFVQQLQTNWSYKTVSVLHTNALSCHTLQTIQGCRYQRVFLLGAAEGLLSTTPKADPYWDWQEKQQVIEKGLPLTGLAEALSEKQTMFKALQAISETPCTFSYAKWVGGKPTVLSNLLDTWAQETIHHTAPLPPSPKADAYWIARQQEQKEEPSLMSEGHVGPIAWPKKRFSVSELIRMGQCGFSWLGRYGYQLYRVEEPTVEISPAQKGQFYHRVMELLLQNTLEQPVDKTGLIQNLPHAFAQAERELFLHKVDAWPAQRLEILQNLERVLAGDVCLPEHQQAVSLEQDFELAWGTYTLSGRIDRVDRGPNGLVVLDYKTSSQAPHGIQNEDAKLSRDLQLAFYMQQALPKLYPYEVVDKGQYVSLTKGTILKTLLTTKAEPCEPWVNNLIQQFRQGQFPVQPDTDGKACIHCDLLWVCRKSGPVAREVETP